MSGRVSIRPLAPVIWTCLFLALSAAAQIEPIGDMPLTLSGQLGVGFSGGNGSVANARISSASRSFVFTGSGTLDGYFHDVRFLKFSVSPNINLTRNGNGDQIGFQGLNNGVSTNVGFLSGSSMPINVQYSWFRTSSTTINNGPGAVEYASIGSSRHFGINWSFHKRNKLPSFSASYGQGSSSSKLAGAKDEGVVNNQRSLTLLGNYQLAGFRFYGSYNRFGGDQRLPDIFRLNLPENYGKSKQDSRYFGVSRQLPRNTNFDIRYNKTNTETNEFGTPLDRTFDTAGMNVTSTPIKRLILNFSADYMSNGLGMLVSLIFSDGTVITAPLNLSGRSFSYSTGASYGIGHGFTVSGAVSHSDEKQMSTLKIVSDNYMGSLSYARALWKGMFQATYSAGSMSAEFQLANLPPQLRPSNSSLAQNGTVGYARRLSSWMMQAQFRSANTGADTAGVPVTLISKTYGGNVNATRRLWNRWNFELSGNYSKSDLTPHTSGMSQGTIQASISNRTLGISAQQQFGTGFSAITTAGILPVSVTALPSETLFKLYNTGSRGTAVAVTWRRRRLAIVSNYSRSSLDLDMFSRSESTGNTNFDVRATYKLRKVDVRAEFRHWTQHSSANKNLNLAANSYMISVVRQFRAF